jgi:hypothetical protein
VIITTNFRRAGQVGVMLVLVLAGSGVLAHGEQGQ